MIFPELSRFDRSDLQQTADRLDLAVLESVMLWPGPDEAEERRIAILQSFIRRGLELRDALTREEVLVLLEQSVNLPPLSETKEKAEPRHIHGAIAGQILIDVVTMGQLPEIPRHSVSDIIDHCCNAICRETNSREFQVRSQTVKNSIWPRYRRVAHLWAAVLNSGRQTWPCQLSDLETFLATAEAWRRLGSEVRPAYSDTTILVDAAEIPGANRLPAVTLKFVGRTKGKRIPRRK